NDERDRFSTRTAIDGLPGVELVGERTELRSGLLLARQLRPRILLLDLPEKCDEALIAAGSFKLDFPDIALFLMSNTLDPQVLLDRKRTRLNSSHVAMSYAVFCLKKKNYFICNLMN